MKKVYNPGAWHYITIINGPTHEIWVLIVYAHKPTLNANTTDISRTRGINFGQSSSTFILLCMQAVKAQASLYICTDLSEPSCLIMRKVPNSQVLAQIFCF